MSDETLEHAEHAGNRLVLIADGNTARGQRLVAACERAGVQCKMGPHGAAALEMALRERPGLIVAQVDLPLVDAPKLAEILRANPRTRRSRFLFLGGSDRANPGAPGDLQLPEGSETDAVVRAIEELIGRQARLDAVDQAASDGGAVEGDLELVALPELLGLFQANRASGCLRLEHPDEDNATPDTGLILIRDGDVLQAECGSAINEKALFRLFAWRHGSFSFEPGDTEEPAFIATSTRLLLQEGLRQLEEWDRLSTKLPPLDSRVHMRVQAGELPNIVHPLTQEVLLLLELYPTVREVVDHCSFPDYQVLRTLHTLADREIVEVGHAAVLPSASTSESEVLFNDAQIRRLREWIENGTGPRERVPSGKILIAASSPAALPDFAKLLADVPGACLSQALRDGSVPEPLAPLCVLELETGLRIELLYLPVDETFSPLWALAGHRALGTLFLLSGPVGPAAEVVAPVCEVLSEMSRFRTFHVALLHKGERITPDELRENLELIDEASLFLLPVESDKPAASLLRGLFSRIVP